jgi:hypothetical protein
VQAVGERQVARLEPRVPGVGVAAGACGTG